MSMDDSTLAVIASDPTNSSGRTLYRATIAYHPDLNLVGASTIISNAKNQIFEICRTAPEFKIPGQSASYLIGDRYISRKPVSLQTTNDGIVIAGHPQGTPVYVEKEALTQPIMLNRAQLESGVLLNFSGRVLVLIHVANQILESIDGLGMLGMSDGIEAARKSIQRVSQFDVPVLIRGETGTGKELIANAIHQMSQRATQRMVSINVGAIPESLVISELFGVKKGAFTGASRDKAGYFEQAHGSSLFLDEIGDAPDEVQVALLRALETQEIQPVGSSDSVKVNVRMIAATDANVEDKISGGSFRTPLLQRLAGYEIWLPPLRQRRVDIAVILMHFLRREISQLEAMDLTNPEDPDRVAFWRKIFSSALSFHWPGNIRQLRNIAQQLVIHNRQCDQMTVPVNLHDILLNQVNHSAISTPRGSVDFDSPGDVNHSAAPPPTTADTPQNRRKPSDISEEELLHCLEAQRYDLKNTAETLSISRAALYKMIDKNPKVRKAGDLSGSEIQHSYQQCQGNLDQMVEALKVSKAALKRRIREMQLG